MKLAAKRNFNVNYYEKNENIWCVESHLSDEPHDITLNLEINMKDMVICSSKIKFDRFPLSSCPMIEEKANQLVGIKVDNMFTRNAMNIFMGSHGCPNIMTLLNISVPGIIYYYYGYRIKTGLTTRDEWNTIMLTDLKDACLGHTMLDK